MIRKKKYLVFGGAGSIGSELVRQLCIKNKVFIFDIDETRTYDLYEELRYKKYNVDYRIGDIRNKEIIKEVFKWNPDIVINAAAYKHVSPMERYPREAIETNELGTLNILDETKCKYIQISSDKAVNAESVMGISKRMAEKITLNVGGIVVRFGNVLASRGSVLELWQRQLNHKESLTVTHERMERYMMSIEQACGLIIKAIEIAKPKSIMIMDMGERVNILKLAVDILKKSNSNAGIKMIGIRPGEVLIEILMTPEEEKRAIKVNNFWIISK